jgi:G3E family GTPase
LSQPLTRIPIIVLTGFLGSGKTTLLNKLLKSSSAGSIAVIVNEFGEIGIDNTLLVEACDGNMVLLESGCVCCTVKDSLAITLEALYEKRCRGLIPPYEHVVLETTGLADPGPILHLLSTEPLVAARYRVEGVVATVDTVNGWNTLSSHRTAVKQIALADALIITKTDLAPEGVAALLRSRLREINMSSPLFDAKKYESNLLSRALFDGAAATFAARRGISQSSAENHDQPQHLHSHIDGISTFSFEGGSPISWSTFSSFLAQLNALKGDDLLRVKGIVAVRGQPKPVVLHGVQQLIHSPGLLEAWSDNRGTRVVFIVRDAILGRARSIVRDHFGEPHMPGGSARSIGDPSTPAA